MNEKLKKLEKKITEIDALKQSSAWGAEFQVWEDITARLVQDLFGGRGLELFKNQSSVVLTDDAYLQELEGRRRVLQRLLNHRNDFPPDLPTTSSTLTPTDSRATTSLYTPTIPNKIGETIWVWKALDGFFEKLIKRTAPRRILISVLFVFAAIFLVKTGIWISRDTGHFTYQPQSQGYGSLSAEKPGIIRILFQADVRNISSSPRYLRNFEGVLWKKKYLGSTWSYTYSSDTTQVFLVQGASTTPLILPILFAPNESRTLEWRYEIDASNDSDILSFLSQQECRGEFCWNKNNFDILLVDSRGNIFDQNGNLQSQVVIDDWWVWPNNRSFSEKSIAATKLIWDIFAWKIAAFVPLLK